jgi:hypothetical protein
MTVLAFSELCCSTLSKSTLLTSITCDMLTTKTGLRSALHHFPRAVNSQFSLHHVSMSRNVYCVGLSSRIAPFTMQLTWIVAELRQAHYCCAFESECRHHRRVRRQHTAGERLASWRTCTGCYNLLVKEGKVGVLFDRLPHLHVI